LVFERRILRRIFDPTQKANGEWRLKTNEELENAIGYENIFFNPVPHMSFTDFVVFPLGHGRSVTDF